MFCFIKSTEEFNTFEKPVAAPYIRKSFICESEANAEIKIAACGFYDLYINGKRLTKGFLAPYISNTNDYVYYDEYEISLEKGENVVGIILGNGLQNNPGGYVWDFDKASFRSAPMVAFYMRYKNAVGEWIEIKSDTTFKTAASPIKSDDYRFGEVYDANFEIEGWNEKGFDDSNWNNVILAQPPKGELKKCTAEPIIEKYRVKPVSITKDEDGYIYDFGVSDSGICQLKIKGYKGQKIEFQHADLLADGKFVLDNCWFVNRFCWERDKDIVHKDIYICKSDNEEIYTPRFTYHGFRYVKVTGITSEQAIENLLTFIAIHSDLKTMGNFSCSDEIVNKLQQATRRSDLSNFHYFPTDCPHREKNGWTADIALSSEHMLLNFNPENSYREWIYNLCKAQKENGELPGIVPTGGWGFDFGNGPAWDCALVYLPYYVYIYRGNTDMIHIAAASIIAYLKYLLSMRDKKGLMHIGLGDWCHVGTSTEDTPPKAPLIVTDSIISMDIAEKAGFLFEQIGLKKQSEFALNIAAYFKKAIRDNLIDFDNLTVYGDCQTCQAMGLYYGIFKEEEQQEAFNILLKFIHDFDDHIDLGVLGARIIFHLLAKFGYSELAYKMITRTDYPSYGNWIVRGATTLWENFDPDTVYSSNHHFWGDISAWFIKCIAGIQINPNGNDLKNVFIKPSFIEKLENAEGYHITVFGKISSAWKREDDGISIDLEIPKEITATLILPDGYMFDDGTKEKQVVSGMYRVKKS